MKALKITGLTIVSLLVAVILIVLFGSGGFMHKKYLEPWNIKYSQKFTDIRIQTVACGILAANSHNMQPWKIVLDQNNPDKFELFLDSERLTPQVDPLARQTTVSQGTFLEYVSVAAQHFGYQADITLFPEGEFDATGSPSSVKMKPVAQVILTVAPAVEHPLFIYMFQPDTNRTAYQKAPLTQQQLDLVKGLNNDPALSIDLILDESERQTLGQLAMKGAQIESAVSRVSAESASFFRVNEYQKNRFRYGFSVEGQGISGLKLYLTQAILTVAPFMNSEKTTNDSFMALTRSEIDNTPAYVLIKTRDNSRSSQVKAGRLYSRLQLTAESVGLAIQPLSQILEEYPEMKDLCQQVHQLYAPHGDTIQMLVRLGQPNSQVPHSMRRDVMEIFH